ncbi:uncharacterized protein DUF3109 [Breznakibacter xylanolyticus]|uniref:Uncharacterized protein DUF3109 n=1 Tax=Breznakibacter xylanolyticus TaxID=990 RepID=A0A2W7NJX7_9BACT|nr:DUF3109 family protein [Breznakibacter xylanolyticus]PZX20751.1 uncharacterized protein DUF3109 [Breznakibacter xylanolyticus]
MVQIDDTLISLDVFEKKFVCDLGACKGECCVEGESGAPLDDAEAALLEEIYPLIKPYLLPNAIAEIEAQGKWVIDWDDDKVTPIINGRECVYAIFDADGTCKCAIEQAYNDGVVSFKKPISCHLYPIRISKVNNMEALNFHKWEVCKVAFLLGHKLNMPVYKFLKDPIVRKYGIEFYDQMEIIEKELRDEGHIK